MQQFPIPATRPKKLQQLFDFSKGQNSFDDPLILAENYLAKGQNVRINRTGQIVTRLGQTQVGDTIHASNPILSVHGYQDETGTKVPLAQVTTVLYELIAGTWTSLKTGLAATKLKFETFRGISSAAATDSGTATGGSLNTLADSGKAWSVDAYRGKFLRNNTTGEIKVIESNTATTITIEGKWDTNAAAGHTYEILTGKSVAYAVNGTDKFKVTASGAQANLTTGNWQAFKWIVAHGNRLFGFLNNSSRFFYSDFANGENFPKLNFIDVQADDGDKLTAFASANALMVICKERSTHVLTGNSRDNFSVTPLSKTAGCIAPFSMRAGNGVAYFMGHEGVYRCDGRSEPVLISRNIKDKLDEHTQAEKEASNAVIDEVNGYYIITVGDETFVYAIDKDAWCFDDNYVPNCWANAEDSNGAPILYIGDSEAGKVWQADSGTGDHGSENINSVIETIKTANARYGFPKRYGRGRVFIKATPDFSSLVTLEANVEDAGYRQVTVVNTFQDAAEWDEDEWDIAEWDSPEAVIQKFRVNRKGRYIQLKATKNDNLGQVTFYGIVLEHKERNFR